jgi:hypothetical protein
MADEENPIVIGADLVPAQADITSRLSEIDAIRSSDLDTYFARGLDREELALRQEMTGELRFPVTNAPDVVRENLLQTPAGAALVAEWGGGHFGSFVRNAQSAALEVLKGLEVDLRGQRIFLEHFDRGLSDATQKVVYSDLAMGPSAWFAPATDQQIADFAATSVGTELVYEWGSEAAERVGRVVDRLRRIYSRLSDADKPKARAWLDGLTPREARAVFGYLSK